MMETRLDNNRQPAAQYGGLITSGNAATRMPAMRLLRLQPANSGIRAGSRWIT
jgi:hypothetical protein